MTGFGFRKNILFSWSGANFRIERLHENGDVLLERSVDGVMSVQTRKGLSIAGIAAIAERTIHAH